MTWLVFALSLLKLCDARIVELTDENFVAEVESGPYLVNFFTEWSNHARRFKTVFVQVEKELRGEMKVGQIDLGKYDQLYKRLAFIETYDVKTHPTVHLFDDGKWYRFPMDRDRTIEEVLDFARKGFINTMGHDIEHVDYQNVTDTYEEYENIKVVHPETGVLLGDAEVRTFTDENYEEVVQDGRGPFTWMIMFESDNCGECEALVPTLQKTQRQLRAGTKQQVARANIDHNPELKAKFQIEKTPSIYMIHNRKYYILEQPKKMRCRDLVGFAEGGFLLTNEGFFIEDTLQILDMDGNVIEERGPNVGQKDEPNNEDNEQKGTKSDDKPKDAQPAKEEPKKTEIFDDEPDIIEIEDDVEELEVKDEPMEDARQSFGNIATKKNPKHPQKKAPEEKSYDAPKKAPRKARARKEDMPVYNSETNTKDVPVDIGDDDEPPLEIVMFLEEQLEVFQENLIVLANDCQIVWETKPFVLLFASAVGMSFGTAFATVVFYCLVMSRK